MWTRSELKEKAKVVFKANYLVSVLAGLILMFFSGGGSSSAGRNSAQQDTQGSLDGISTQIIVAVVVAILLIAIFLTIVKIVVGNALIVGCHSVFIGNELSKGEMPTVRDITFVFRSGSWKNVTLSLFIKDLTVALMSLLLVIPGIWMSFVLMMVPYILAENPGMDRREAFRLSKQMMDGQKWNTFVLLLSFIPWVLLGIITCGLGMVLYVGPYIYQTLAELYLTLKKNV